MAQDTFGDFDATSSNNSTIEGDATDGSVDISEGCLPGNINNAIRALMAAGNKAFGDLPSGTSRPSYLTSGRFWKDTTTAASPIVKFYDGTDDITVFTIDTSENSVTFAGVSGGPTLDTAVATTSGTEVDFTSLPAGINRIDIFYIGVSLSGNDEHIIQIGDSGGFETTGYESNVIDDDGSSFATDTSTTSGFRLTVDIAGNVDIDGVVNLYRADGNQWVYTGHVFVGVSAIHHFHGEKTLSGELDRVRLTTLGGGNTFDSGKVNIQYQ